MRLSLSFFVLATGLLLSHRVAAGELTWEELSHRSDLWPSECTATETIPLQRGVVINTGEKLHVVRFMGNSVQVTPLNGKFSFATLPGQTDFLQLAQARYNALPPRQRDVGYEVLDGRMDLWPAEVAAAAGFRVPSGRNVEVGEKVAVIDYFEGTLAVQAPGMGGALNIPAAATDFLVRARQLAEDEKALPRFLDGKPQLEEQVGRNGRVLAELEGKLIDPVTGQATTLRDMPGIRFIAFFRGSAKDPLTKGFTPTLLKFYQAARSARSNFAIIYVETEPEVTAQKFAAKLAMPWPALTQESARQVTSLTRAIGPGVPQLLVVDRSGHVIIDGGEVEVLAALKRFDQVLQTTPAGN